jgi:hypothetical protein
VCGSNSLVRTGYASDCRIVATWYTGGESNQRTNKLSWGALGPPRAPAGPVVLPASSLGSDRVE